MDQTWAEGDEDEYEDYQLVHVKTEYVYDEYNGYYNYVSDFTFCHVAEVNGDTALKTFSIRAGWYNYWGDATITYSEETIGGGGGSAGLNIISYGSSTWANFIAAYTTNTVVYCRASSNANPASGSQTRLAFMAYVNNAENPTEVEFQYYRSVATHSDSQQGDQVFVYKLTKTGGWSVTTRNAFTKIVAGTGLTSSYSNGVLTISLDS